MWIEFTPLGMVSSGTIWRGFHTSWEVSHSNVWLPGPSSRTLLPGIVQTSQFLNITGMLISP
jgi:hypothetical protein